MAIAAAFVMPHPPVILPEVGKGQERNIEKTRVACEKVAGIVAEIKPDTVVLISPHSIMYGDYFHISPGERGLGDFSKFGAPEVRLRVEYDQEFVRALEKEAHDTHLQAGTLGEKERQLDHGTMIPLVFINQKYDGYKLVRIGLSGLPEEEHLRLGKTISAISQQLNRRVVLIASGDLSHKLKEDGPYGFDANGPVFDKKVLEIIEKGDLSQFLSLDKDASRKAAECGLGSFLVMAGALQGKMVDTEVLSYEGPFGVGYGVARLSPEDLHVHLAKASIKKYIQTGRRLSLEEWLRQISGKMKNTEYLEELLHRKAGVFVSLKKSGQLRGCIGTILSTTESVAEEILQNSISAASSDPRFEPVREEELSQITYSVDVLSEAEPIESADQLDVKRYGVIVLSGRKRGLLLPNLEGVDTVEEQIAIALSKAGISRYEPYELERFEVVRHL